MMVHLTQCLIQDPLLSPEFYFVDSAVLVTQLFLCWYLERNKNVIMDIFFSSCAFNQFSPAASVS